MQYGFYDEEAHEKGHEACYVNDLSFRKVIKNGEHFLLPASKDGEGFVYQIHPAPGIFISIGDWRLYTPKSRQYQVARMFMEIYFIESGDITLIQNGKKTFYIPQGVNVYLNRPSKGRLCYGAGTPIKYVSITLFDDFIKQHIENDFPENEFSFSETFHWQAHNYNTPEITLLFLQLRQKLLSFEKSRLYYESKIGELLSVVMSNFIRGKRRLEACQATVSPDDLMRLEKVRTAIDKNIINPPDMMQLSQIAAMGKTKLRESFKAVYHMPLGGYVREAKMRHALMLLANREMAVQNVGARLGYASASKFSIAFKKVYGVSPEDYRKNILLIYKTQDFLTAVHKQAECIK